LIDIYQASFSCGHIISEFNGGLNKIENLMPICNSCNSSMGIKDMNEYKKEFFDNNFEKKNVNKINEQKTKNIIINGNFIINRNISNNH
jgi:5-methylcytosine-specific restriction endonuclease McrA